MRLSLAAAVLVNVLLAACGPGSLDSIKFTDEESLPGFDIALPAGMKGKRSTSDIGGQIALTGRGATVVVSWRAGDLSADEIRVMGRASLEMIGKEHGGGAIDELAFAVPAPDHGLQFVMPMRGKPLLVLTIVRCEKANVTAFAMTQASPDRARALAFHERLVSTLRCRQDAAPLTIEADLPDFAAGDDAGYLRGAEPPAFYSIGGGQWTVVAVPTYGSSAVPADFVRTLLERIGLHVIDERPVDYRGAAGWTLKEITVDAEGERLHMLHGLLSCAAGRRYLVLYADVSAPEAPQPSAFDRLSCPIARIDPAKLPSAVARFAAACDGGNGAACAYQVVLAESQPALLGDRDAAAVRARACELGVEDLCAAAP